jgi:ribosome-associated toxin RatA of RatAB toxin-antitoxin module
MRSSIGIAVRATPERVFALAHDVSRWPELLPHYRQVVIERHVDGRVLARMVAVRWFGPLPVPVTWRAEQWSDPDDPAGPRLHFRHVRGVTRGMRVTWRITATPTGARIVIDHEFRRPLPLVGDELLPRMVDRWFTRPIASRTLRTFRDLAEAGEDGRSSTMDDSRADS